MLPTLNYALLFGSIAAFDTPISNERSIEGQIGDWRYKLHIGPFPEDILIVLSTVPAFTRVLKDIFTGGPGSSRSPARDPFAERDNLVKAYMREYRLDEPWSHPGRLYTSIQVSKEVSVSQGEGSGGYSYFLVRSG